MRTGSTGWWPLETFRKLMGVDGSNYYESFKHLNAKIIKPAVAEVNRSSDILIEPELRKKGRAVTDIRFRIRENPQLAMFTVDDSEGVRNTDVYKALRAQGVADRLARQWINEHGADYVREKLAYVQARGDVKSAAGYLSAAIREDYRPAEAAPPAPPDPETLEKAARVRRQTEQVDAERDARLAERAERARKFAIVNDLVSRRNPTQRDADRRLFMATLKDDLERAEFRAHGWNAALVASRIFAFWEEIEPDAFA